MDNFDEVLKRGKILMIGALLLTGLVGAAPADADPAETYKVFVDRNPFGLKDPPPPPKPPAPPVVEEPTQVNLKLTGISNIRGRVRVMFVNQPPGEEPEYLSIVEGNRRDGVEVIKGGVNIEKGEVKVKIDNYTKTLSFENDGFAGGKLPGAGGKKVAPIRATPSKSVPTSRIPSPTTRPQFRGSLPNSRSTSSGSGRTTSFQRPVRTSSAARSSSVPSFTARSSSGLGIPAPASAGRTIRLNAGAVPTAVNPPKPKNVPSPEQQAALMELNAAHERANPNVVEVRPGEFITVEAPPIPRAQ